MAIQKPNSRRLLNKDEEDERKASEKFFLPTLEELTAIEEKAKEDATRVVSSEKGLDFFQRPSNWDDGYQFGDVTKTALGTLGDVGVNAVKGVVRMGEGIGDAAQYGAAALADLFGADEKAEAIRQNAQRDKVTEAFSGVDEKLNKYSVLGRTSDAAAESLGQIGAIVGTAGLAGALGAGAVGTTAATTGLMGLSSFGSGTGEAYAAGADEGEAEAYGAIAGAADALSEMIFGGLGKGFKAIGLSKGITSADDLLAKAVTSKIRNTLAKNAVQLGIKAGAEGLEEVLAGTMQAAGKKATYMSERDFADIIKDENLLEQFVVGAMASGISQTPSFVSATRAGVDLVSDGADAASDSVQDEQDKFAALRDKNADFGEIERTGLASGAKDEDIRMAGELSTALGKKIRFFREDAKNGTINNGEYHEDTGEIWINTRSKNVKAQIVAHELTHSIEKNDGYRQLVDLTMNKLEEEQKAKGKTIDDLYREKETLYADGGVRLASYDEITSELVAEYVEKRLLTDEKSIKSLVSENRTLGQRIREWFDSLLAKMGNASAKEREYIRQMRDMYARALGEKTSTAGDGEQHSIKRTKNVTYEKQISELENGRFGRSDSLYIGAPSDALKSAGFSENPFAMNQSDYRKSRRSAGNNKSNSAHNVPKDFFDDMPKYLADASMIIDNGDRATIVTSYPMTDTRGNPSFVVAGVWKDNSMESDTVNQVKSVYPRDGLAEYLRRSEEEGKLVILDKEKADSIFAAVGKQYSEGQGAIDFSQNSISQDSENVNSKFSVSRVDDPLAGKSSAVETEVEELDIESDVPYVYQYGSGDTQPAPADLASMENVELTDSDAPYAPAADENTVSIKDRGNVGKQNINKLRKQTAVFKKKAAELEAQGVDLTDDIEYARLVVGSYEEAVKLADEAQKKYEEGKLGVTTERRAQAREALSEYMEALGIGRGYQKESTDSTDAEFSGNPRFEELKAARNEYYQTIDAINDINDQLSSKQRDLTEAERVELYDERRDLEQHARELDEWIKYVQASMRSRKSKTDDDFANQREAYNPRIVEGSDAPAPTDEDIPQQQKQSKGLTAEKADDRMAARQNKREKRKTVAKAETAFKRLGYDIEGAIVDNYEDAAGIIEDNTLAAQVESDINKYIKDNQVQFYVDNTAKLLARGDIKLENVALTGDDLTQAKLLADMYRQFMDISDNSIREQGKKNTNIVNEELDDIFRGYDWFTEPDKKQKRLREQLQLSLANPEQVMRDVFGDAKIVKDEDGSERLLNVAERLNEYIIRPTIENSARARRQTNQMVSGLRSLGLTEAESGITQIFAEYSDIEESKSKKPTISESDLRYMLMTKMDADGFAEQIARKEYGQKETKEKKEFRDSIVEQLQNEINVNEAKARQRALRDHKAKGGTNASWNALSENERNAKIDAAYKTVTDESIGRIVNGTKELRKLLDDMYEAINAVSVIHGAAPIPFRRGYMPHSHRQTEELQKWFNDHMGGLNVTPVQDLPTDIAGKTADRKPNKRWFSHAQQRTGPRTTWDALGNIEDYLRIANDTIYHMDDIRKMRVLERYIRGIYSVARGATGEEQRTRVKNDVMQRLHGEEVDLVFLGLQPLEKKQKISDEDMDLSQMTTFVTWLTNYTNDLAAKQIFNRDIESFAGRKVNNLANTLTSWSSRTMMQYNISSNLKQLSQLGTVSGDVGARISKDAAAMTLRSMQNLGNGTNELEQKYHISERSTFLAEKEAIEEATFASDKDLTEKQKTDRQRAKEIWDYAWSMTDTTMSRYAVYAYFMEGMNRGMDDTAALHYADTKARNILASRMKGSSPLIFQSKNPILRMFTLFQREPLAAWQDILKTMPREYQDMKIGTDEKTAKEQITKRITGRLLGAGIVNTVYATVLGLGTPAMFDILGEPIRALLDKLWKDITPDEEDDITFKEMAERYISTLGDEIADDIPFANVVSLIANTYAGTEFESRLALNAPDLGKIFGLLGLGGKAAWNGAQLLWSDDAEDIELLEELSTIPGQIPVTILDMITEIVGTAAPAGNQIRKSAKGLIAVLRSGEYTKDGKLKYEVGGVGDSIRAVLLGSSNTRAGQEWIASGFESLSKTETEAYKALIGAGVSEKRARQYVERVAEAEKVADETQAQAEARMIDRMTGLNKQQKAELYYDMVATDNQRAAVDAAVGAGAKIDDAVETARAIRDSSKKLDRLTALQASDMDTDAREEMYLAMVATKVKDADGNVIGTEDDDLLEALYATGLDFDDFLDAKQMQSVLNANESLTANQRASRFLAWTASQGYTQAQADVIGENFGFSSGFRVKSETYQKIVDNGVTAENAVKVTDALAGKTKTADKINAVWSTGLSGNQLDLAVKSVLSEKAYERYRIVVDANIPLEIYTWALLNADQDAEGEKGHGSVNNTERELILSQLALPRKDLSALWLALGGSEKSNPYSGNGGNKSGGIGVKIEMPKVEVPKIEMPKIELPKIGG